jgi:hypothetical protein
MPQSCTVCRNPERSAIDAALVENQSLRHIGKYFTILPRNVFFRSAETTGTLAWRF